MENSKKAIEIANKYPNCFAAVGFHPIHIEKEKFDETKFLELAKNAKVVAIGECGIDLFHDKNTADLQKEILVKHLKIAQIVSKPIILHCREAYDDLMTELMSFGQLPTGVVHCYVGDWLHAQMFLDMGLYLSFTGIITFSKSPELAKVVENTPLERIMIETDSPYLAPENYRGVQNEPAYVVEIAKKIAQIKKIPLSEVEAQTTKNAIKLFKLSSNEN